MIHSAIKAQILESYTTGNIISYLFSPGLANTVGKEGAFAKDVTQWKSNKTAQWFFLGK